MHRLLQDAVRLRLTDQTWRAPFEVVVDLLTSVYPKQVLGMAMDNFWDQCDMYLPQVVSISAHFSKISSKFPTDPNAVLDDTQRKTLQAFSRLLVELIHNATW